MLNDVWPIELLLLMLLVLRRNGIPFRMMWWRMFGNQIDGILIPDERNTLRRHIVNGWRHGQTILTVIIVMRHRVDART